ncbi:MAG: phosphoribosyltransferase [Candidatus Altiarchaeales archaeon WOR_SM1_86-2]|nr:MAG: phosphoribosyltransferase [Candidatus Altiarchaeales archaeon WOR_SM1_86-2]ODS38340.1 MAG: phosphoribosyltransferase [Candidatus Altiarchaeales archaeon WOR_SM1_79]
MFEDRKDAGEKLAGALGKYKGKEVLVLAIPRGGVEVGYEVAKYLGANLSVLISRKLPYPDNPEAGFGAIAEDGSTFIFEHAYGWLSKETIDGIVEEQKREIKRRVDVLRKGKPLPEITGKEVILVDDGIAMGSTMRASIMLCKNKKAGKIIAAVPVSGEDAAEEIGKMVDEMVVLEKPVFFRAVAQVYRNWYDVPDEEVIEILNSSKSK